MCRKRPPFEHSAPRRPCLRLVAYKQRMPDVTSARQKQVFVTGGRKLSRRKRGKSRQLLPTSRDMWVSVRVACHRRGLCRRSAERPFAFHAWPQQPNGASARSKIELSTVAWRRAVTDVTVPAAAAAAVVAAFWMSTCMSRISLGRWPLRLVTADLHVMCYSCSTTVAAAIRKKGYHRLQDF